MNDELTARIRQLEAERLRPVPPPPFRSRPVTRPYAPITTRSARRNRAELALAISDVDGDR